MTRKPRWRTRDGTLLVKDEGRTHHVLTEPVKAYGPLCVHSKHYDVEKPRPSPGSWVVKFRFLTDDWKTKAWVVTHWSSGVSISKGPKGRGFKSKRAARRFSERLVGEYGHVLDIGACVRTDDAVERMRSHTDYDSMVKYINFLIQELESR